MDQYALDIQSAGMDKYVGDPMVESEYVARIFSGEAVSRLELASNLRDKTLTMEQVIRVGNLISTHQNMLANNPAAAARFNRMDATVKGALTSWMGSDYGNQTYLSALSAMGEAVQGWEADPKNANFSATSPEYLKFVTDTSIALQRQFMETSKWEEMQDTQAQVEADNKLEIYGTKLFEADTSTLTRWYAESLMIPEGRAPSSDLADFLTQAGRQLDADDLSQEAYGLAIASQLKLAGVDMAGEDFKTTVDSLIANLRPGVDPASLMEGASDPVPEVEEAEEVDPTPEELEAMSPEDRSRAWGRMQLRKSRDPAIIIELGKTLIVRPVVGTISFIVETQRTMAENARIASAEADWSEEAWNRASGTGPARRARAKADAERRTASN
jgi:hypothetical protein